MCYNNNKSTCIQNELFFLLQGKTTESTPSKNCKKQKLQMGLNFVDIIIVVSQWNRNVFESIWHITNKTIKELFTKYCKLP